MEKVFCKCRSASDTSEWFWISISSSFWNPELISFGRWSLNNCHFFANATLGYREWCWLDRPVLLSAIRLILRMILSTWTLANWWILRLMCHNVVGCWSGLPRCEIRTFWYLVWSWILDLRIHTLLGRQSDILGIESSTTRHWNGGIIIRLSLRDINSVILRCCWSLLRSLFFIFLNDRLVFHILAVLIIACHKLFIYLILTHCKVIYLVYSKPIQNCILIMGHFFDRFGSKILQLWNMFYSLSNHNIFIRMIELKLIRWFTKDGGEFSLV